MVQFLFDVGVGVKRAYDKGIFDDSENMIKIQLRPIIRYYYRLIVFHWGFQKNSTSIAEVLPYILKLFDIWQKIDVSHEP